MQAEISKLSIETQIEISELQRQMCHKYIDAAFDMYHTCITTDDGFMREICEKMLNEIADIPFWSRKRNPLQGVKRVK